jgi:hypothetical protein
MSYNLKEPDPDFGTSKSKSEYSFFICVSKTGEIKVGLQVPVRPVCRPKHLLKKVEKNTILKFFCVTNNDDRRHLLFLKLINYLTSLSTHIPTL